MQKLNYTPVVSVLIPTYNSAAYLDEAIQSVLDQTFTDFELIIVDNQSTDNTDEVVSRYLIDKRIRYYKNDVNIGMAGNWNQCLSYANGEYIKFLCSDDKFHPSLLQEFVSIFEDYPTVSLVTSFRTFFGSRNEGVKAPFTHFQSGIKMLEHSVLTYNWIGEPTSVMFRKNNLWLGTFKTELKWIIDWELWLRMLSVGDLYVIPKYLSYFRQHEEQGTVSVKRDFINLFEEYNYLNFLSAFTQYSFIKDKPFVDKKKSLAQNCCQNFYYFLKLGRSDLAKQALDIGYREKVLVSSFTNLFVKIVKSRFRFK